MGCDHIHRECQRQRAFPGIQGSHYKLQTAQINEGSPIRFMSTQIEGRSGGYRIVDPH